MTTKTKQKVSSTALGTCIMRSTSYYERNLCYKSEDFIAPQVVPVPLRVMAKYNILRCLLKKAVFKVPGIYEYVIARTKFIDEIFKGLPGNIEQVLIFGAGFDSRAIRFGQELKNVKVFELDARSTQQAKLNRFKESNINTPANVNYISIDFNKESLLEKLKEAGFESDRRCLFLLEGLTYYLENEAIDTTLRLLSDYCATGSLLIFDYADAKAARHEMDIDEHKVKQVHQTLVKKEEKPGFVLEEIIQDFLDKYKFELVEEATSACLAKRYFGQADFALAAQKFRIVKAIKK